MAVFARYIAQTARQGGLGSSGPLISPRAVDRPGAVTVRRILGTGPDGAFKKGERVAPLFFAGRIWAGLSDFVHGDHVVGFILDSWLVEICRPCRHHYPALFKEIAALVSPLNATYHVRQRSLGHLPLEMRDLSYPISEC